MKILDLTGINLEAALAATIKHHGQSIQRGSVYRLILVG
jgi:hypothetical protein